jgi:prevent-host-death family protein
VAARYPMKNTWQMNVARRSFGQVIDRTLAQGPQIITRRGQRVVVVLPYEEYGRLTRRTGSLSQFLLASPLRGSKLKIGRG